MSCTAPCSGPVDDPVVGDIERFLEDAIGQLSPAISAREQTGPGSTRRILPSMLLWAGLLVCVLHGFQQQRSLWRLLTQRGLWGHPPLPLSDEAVYKRLGHGGTAVLEHLFTQISAVLRDRLAPYAQTALAPFATAVYALDETTLDQVARLLPALRGTPAGDRSLLPGKLAALFDLRRQQWTRIEHQPNPEQNEKVAARRLVAGLARGSLLLADLGYFGFAWFDWLSEQGYWWVSRLRAKTSYTVAHTFYHQGDTRDALVWLGAYRADRTKHLVRLVEFSVGAAHYRYVTNVLDPHVLPMGDIARLYARRWDIELAFKLAKVQLKLGLLWAARPTVILQQVWAVLIIAQVLQALRLEIAGRVGVDPFEVSLPLLIEYLPFFASFGGDPMRAFLEDGRRVGFIRPSKRTQIQAPVIPVAAYVLPPPDLVGERTPRYAGKA
jgi:hypothetical protein